MREVWYGTREVWYFLTLKVRAVWCNTRVVWYKEPTITNTVRAVWFFCYS